MGLTFLAGGVLRSMPSTEHFISLFVQHERRVYAYIVSLLPDLVEAEDILQETSLVLWQKFSEYEPGSNFLAWACAIARHKTLQHMAKKKGLEVIFSDDVIEVIAKQAAIESTTLDRRHRALAQCMEKLSERDRDLVQRRYADGATVQGVSQQVNRSVDALYKALSRIHESLFNCVRLTLNREVRQ